MISLLRFTATLLLLLSSAAWASEGPSPAEIAKVRAKLQSARAALASQGDKLGEADRQVLSSKLSEAERALVQFDELLARGQGRAATTAPLMAAGGTLVLDDATGVGAADDVLLPFVALGLLATYLFTEPPAPVPEVAAAWVVVLMAMQATAEASKDVKRQAAAEKKADGCYCRCFRRGEGPYLADRQAGPAVCWTICKGKGYSGYQCGGAVIWP